MTTQTTTVQPGTKGTRILIGATAALMVLGGALLWQIRPASEPVTPAATTTTSRTSEGVAQIGAVAEQAQDQQAAARAEAALQERIGGMAELYRDQAPGVLTERCGLEVPPREC